MKKILCFIDAFSLGGAERQLIGLAKFLKQKGYDVTLLAYHQENFYESLLSPFLYFSLSLSLCA